VERVEDQRRRGRRGLVLGIQSVDRSSRVPVVAKLRRLSTVAARTRLGCHQSRKITREKEGNQKMKLTLSNLLEMETFTSSRGRMVDSTNFLFQWLNSSTCPPSASQATTLECSQLANIRNLSESI